MAVTLNEQPRFKRDELEIRPPVEADLDALLALVNDTLRREWDVGSLSRDDLLNDWASPMFDPARDSWLVFAPSGDLVGYLEVWDEPPHVYPNLWATVHPDYRGRGIGSILLDLAEERAQQCVAQAPEGVRVALRTGAPAQAEDMHRLLQGRGYGVVRHFWKMEIALDADALLPEPVWPEGVRVRVCDPARDYPAVFEMVEDAFRDHWGYVPGDYDSWLHHMTSSHHDPALWFLAVTDGAPDGGEEEIVGVSLCRTQRYNDADLGWVSELAVTRSWRRRGLGLALLLHSFRAFHALGRKRVGLGVDAGSLTGATRLYEKAGMHVVIQTDKYERELRAGQDLSTQALTPS